MPSHHPPPILHRTRRRFALLALVVAAGVGVGACGGDDDDASSDTTTSVSVPTGTDIEIPADPGLAQRLQVEGVQLTEVAADDAAVAFPEFLVGTGLRPLFDGYTVQRIADDEGELIGFGMVVAGSESAIADDLALRIERTLAEGNRSEVIDGVRVFSASIAVDGENQTRYVWFRDGAIFAIDGYESQALLDLRDALIAA